MKLAREDWKENRAFRAYCQTATLASFAWVAFALPEALGAARPGPGSPARSARDQSEYRKGR